MSPMKRIPGCWGENLNFRIIRALLPCCPESFEIGDLQNKEMIWGRIQHFGNKMWNAYMYLASRCSAVIEEKVWLLKVILLCTHGEQTGTPKLPRVVSLEENVEATGARKADKVSPENQIYVFGKKEQIPLPHCNFYHLYVYVVYVWYMYI